MRKDKDYWTPIFDEFVSRYPEIAVHIVDWYPSAQMEITVKMDCGKKYSYDWMNKNLYLLCDPEETDQIDEIEWRKKFSFNLSRKLKNHGMSQDKLSGITGISQVTISKYLNCKTTPSTYNVKKMAKALGCSISELVY